MEPPSKEELDKAINLLKQNKAQGIDNITSEILKDGGEALREWPLRICLLIWQTEATPAEWGNVSFYHCQIRVIFPTASPSLIYLERFFSESER